MKFENLFKSFVTNEVNLNPDRFNTATDGIRIISEFLKNNEFFKNKIVSISPQGSFRQKTIIKPNGNKEFDVDMLLVMKEVEGFEPKNYLEALHKAFKDSKRYEDIVDKRGKSRCVTLDYASDFHMDVVPCICKDGGYKIMDRNGNVFEKTDADGYAEWFVQKNNITKGNLVETVKLIKYLRDIKTTFSAKSVLLTTLLGNQVLAFDDVEKLYADIPTTLKTLLNRLNEYLQANENMPIVNNPSLADEDFNRHWDQDKYANFRNMIALYSSKVNEAYDGEDEEQSLKKWQEVFGDGFVLPEEESKELSLKFPDGLEIKDHSHKQKLAEVGLKESLQCKKVNLRAELYFGKPDCKIMNRHYRGDFSSGTKLPLFHWLKFSVAHNIDPRYEIYWQVVNTGNHAKIEGGLRGQIFKGSLSQWERTMYTGVHWIECFIVNPITNVCVGRSGPFHVAFNNPAYQLQ